MLFAYIDPALGSMMLQAVAGLVLAGVVMGRRILVAPFAWLRVKRPPCESDSDLSE
jgi:hypothetical protein